MSPEALADLSGEEYEDIADARRKREKREKRKPRRFIHAHERYHSVFRKAAKFLREDTRLTRSQADLMFRLRDMIGWDGRVTETGEELAEIMRSSPSRVSMDLKALAKYGYVYPIKGAMEDKRRVVQLVNPRLAFMGTSEEHLNAVQNWPGFQLDAKQESSADSLPKSEDPRIEYGARRGKLFAMR